MPRPKKVTSAENLEETITDLVDEVALEEKQSEEKPPEQILIPFHIRSVKKNDDEGNSFYFVYDINDVTKSFVINYTTDITVTKTENVSSYDVYINDDYYGSDLTSLQINTNDNLRVDIVKVNLTKESTIIFASNLI